MKKFLSFALILSTILAVQASAAVNLMTTADQIEASSEFNPDYSAEQTRDGIVMGNDFTLSQWVSDFESEAELTLTWPEAVTVNKAILYDRVSAVDNVASGTITFSDGTVVPFEALEPTGLATEITFEPVTTTSAVIHVVADADTMAVGLDEVEFYNAEGQNVALHTAVKANSVMDDFMDNEFQPANWFPENYTNWYGPEKAVNGYVKAKYPAGAEYEWASMGEANPTLTIDWFDGVTIGTIVLYDRINSVDHVLEGWIEFSDGTEVEFSGLENDGTALYVDIPDIETNAITIYTMTEGPNPGFAEVEVYTEHFENGMPVGSEEAPAPVVEETEAPAPVVEETEAPAPAAEETEAPAPAAEETEAPAVEEVVEEKPAVAPQTFDIAVLLGAVSAACAAVAAITSKKRS